MRTSQPCMAPGCPLKTRAGWMMLRLKGGPIVKARFCRDHRKATAIQSRLNSGLNPVTGRREPATKGAP